MLSSLSNTQHDTTTLSYGSAKTIPGPNLQIVQQLVKACERCIRDEERSIYMLTTTYLDSCDFPLTKSSATTQFERFHRTLLYYLRGNRRINQAWFHRNEPIIYAYLDVPGSKPKHYNPSSVPTKTSTFHHHCIVLAHSTHVPLFDRLALTTEEFVHDSRALCELRTLHVRRVGNGSDDLKRVVAYCSSYFRKHLRDEYSSLLFPKSKSEMNFGNALN